MQRPPNLAKALRQENAGLVFTAGLVIAAFVSIPIVNLATPLFGMVHGSHAQAVERTKAGAECAWSDDRDAKRVVQLQSN
jgi:uncharacterized protein involved in cysteine biosynthesis